MLTNFGMLLPRTTSHPEGSNGVGKYDLLCEEAFGGKVPPRVTRHPDGRLFLPGVDGVYIVAGTCGLQRATGSVMGREITELAVDPDQPQVVWAMGNNPPSLHLSRDGGASFSERQTFTSASRVTRLLLGPAPAAGQPRAIFLGGYTSVQPLALMVSADDGVTFVTRFGTRELFGRPGTATQLFALVPAASPGQPAALLVAAGSPEGPDQIWRSVDAGLTWTMTFALSGMEILSGYVQAEDGAIFVAGRELYVDPGKPVAHLYRSPDGAVTFETPIPSGTAGPRYRCLASRGTRLHACAGEPGDEFLTGHSDDGGRTWTADAQLADLTGQRPCPGNACLATAIWLCQFYGAACDGLGTIDGGAMNPADATVPDAGTDLPGAGGGDGCGCRLGAGSARNPAVGALPLLVGLALLLAARRPRRRH